jgi:hypothetical protein
VKTHKLHAHTWIGILVVIVLVAAHVILLGFVFRSHFSVALVVGMLGIVALKYRWWSGFRRSGLPQGGRSDPKARDDRARCRPTDTP